MDLRRKELGIWAPVVVITVIHLLSLLPFLHLRLDGVGPVALLPMATLFLAVVRVLQARESLDVLVESAPGWMKRGFYVSAAYSAAAVAVGLHDHHGLPEVTPTGFALTNHGRVLRSIGEPEYWQASRNEVGILFGLLIVFAYSAAVAHTLASRHIAAAPPPVGPAWPAMNVRPLAIAGLVTVALGLAIVLVMTAAIAAITAR